MKKLKLYLDTSVISYLDQKDAPEKMADTRAFLERVKAGAFDIVISNVVTREIENCDEKKRQTLMKYLGQVHYTMIKSDERTERIARQFLDMNILKPRSMDDCYHLANAIISESDAIVSWNFKHIVNPRTQQGARAVALLEGYGDLLIYTPSSFIGDDDGTL